MKRAYRRLLAWLLPSCAVVAAVSGAARTQQPADDGATVAAITALLAELDARFARGDIGAYLDAFEPDHPGVHALLRKHLLQLAAARPHLQRSSAIATPPRQLGPRTLVRVRHTLDVGAGQGSAGQSGAGGTGRSFAQDSLLALRHTDDGRWVPTFAIEIPVQWGCIRNDHFRCPPCNYEIGGVAGWLCVPIRPERAQSLEAASFYLLGTDVACDVSVRIDTAAPTAGTVVRALGAALTALDPDARQGAVETWLPPAHQAAPPAGFAAARLEIALPHDFDGRGGIARFHVVTFGGLQHLLLVRGSAAAVRDHANQLQALLASYRLLQTDADLALAAARPLQHHTGGSLAGPRYTNTRFGFELSGPEGWRVEQHCGGAAVRVVWISPAGSRLWLTGYDVPDGLERWCQATADRWLQQLLQRADLQLKTPAPDDAWAEVDKCGGDSRTLVCMPRHPDAGGARERPVRAFLRDELLLVADQRSTNDADAAAMAQALESLQRQ